MSKKKPTSADEQAFLAAIAASPQEGTTRLVYADWLEERDDPRASYLRFLCDAAGWQKNTKHDVALDQLQRLGVDLTSEWKAAVQIGLNWRTLFEANLRPKEQREYGEVYKLNRPATSRQIAKTEKTLGISLPNEVRSLWSEFNGIMYTTAYGRKERRKPESFILNLQGVLSVRECTVEVGWPAVLDEEYGAGTFQNLFIIHQSQGAESMWLLCLAKVGKHKAGTVVFLDHESPELAALAPSLTDFMARRYTKRFSH